MAYKGARMPRMRTVPWFGTYAARPQASPANAGDPYFATDIGTLFVSNGTAWIAQGPEIVQAEHTGTSTVVTSNGTYEDAGLSISVPAGVGPYRVILEIPHLQQNTANRLTGARIASSGGTEQSTAIECDPTAGRGWIVFVSAKFSNPTVATTHKVQLANLAGTGSCFWSLTATNPAKLYAVRRGG